MFIKGRKPGAEDIRARIATHFGMAYEEMLALGRLIQRGEKAMEVEPQVSVLIKASEVRAIAPKNRLQKEGGRESSISRKILKVLEILESKTEYSDSFSEVIDTYHKAIGSNIENQTLAGLGEGGRKTIGET